MYQNFKYVLPFLGCTYLGGEIFYIGIISTIGQKIKLFSFCKIKIVSSLILRVVMRIELHSLPSKISDSLTRNGHSCNDC